MRIVLANTFETARPVGDRESQMELKKHIDNIIVASLSALKADLNDPKCGHENGHEFNESSK